MQANPVSWVNFAPIGTGVRGFPTRIDVKMVAGNLPPLSFTVKITGTPSQAQIRDTVFSAIPQAVNGKNGWAVQSVDAPDGPKIKITGYYDATGKFFPVTSTSFTPDKGFPPSKTDVSGVTPGQHTTGTPWGIALLPSPADGSAAVPTATLFSLTLNNTVVNVNLQAGESLSQAESDTYFALVGAGVDASLSGNTINFLHDPSGQEITTVASSLTPTSQNPTYSNDWFETDVNIAQRTIVS